MNGPKHLWELCFFLLAGWFLFNANYYGSTSLDMAGLSVGVAALLRVAPLLNSLTVALNNIRHSTPSVSFVLESLDQRLDGDNGKRHLFKPAVNEKRMAEVYFANGKQLSVVGSISAKRQSESNGLVLIKGHSGAGKTTIARAIVGIEESQLFDPSLHVLHEQAKSSKGIRWSSQAPVIIDDTMLENINLYDQIPKLRNALEKLRLCTPDTFDDFVSQHLVAGESTISTGQGRRLGLLRALFGPCDFVVLDEPESGLDPISKQSVIELVKHTSKEKKVIVISHTDEFDDACDVFIKVG
jgi:ABC-type transport system involved in cytochrome bd biosynthesis fused ATPase/permease subunit